MIYLIKVAYLMIKSPSTLTKLESFIIQVTWCLKNQLLGRLFIVLNFLLLFGFRNMWSILDVIVILRITCLILICKLLIISFNWITTTNLFFGSWKCCCICYSTIIFKEIRLGICEFKVFKICRPMSGCKFIFLRILMRLNLDELFASIHHVLLSCPWSCSVCHFLQSTLEFATTIL